MTTDKFFDDDEGSASALAEAAPMTDRVNNEPAILKGLSATEAMMAAALFFPVWLIVGGILALVLHRWQILMLLAIVGPGVSVWVFAGFLAGLKRNRPDHYYMHAFRWWRHRFGAGKAPYHSRTGRWELGRVVPNVTASKHNWASALGALVPRSSAASTTPAPVSASSPTEVEHIGPPQLGAEPAASPINRNLMAPQWLSTSTR